MLRRTRETSPPQAAEHTTLPYSILYALRYRQGELNSSNIRPLFKTNLAHLGFYLLMKATDGSDELQSGLLQHAFERGFDYGRLPAARIDEALDYLDAQESPQVNGVKLAEVSRAGFQNWNNRFSAVLNDSVAEEDTLFMVANAPYIGLHQLAQSSLLRMKNLGIVKPSRLGQSELPVGLLVQPQGGGIDITPLGHDFERPGAAVVFDDVLHNGDTRREVLDYWASSGGDQPRFVTAVTVSSDI